MMQRQLISAYKSNLYLTPPNWHDAPLNLEYFNFLTKTTPSGRKVCVPLEKKERKMISFLVATTFLLLHPISAQLPTLQILKENFFFYYLQSDKIKFESTRSSQFFAKIAKLSQAQAPARLSLALLSLPNSPPSHPPTQDSIKTASYKADFQHASIS